MYEDLLMFNLPADILFQIYEFDSFKYDVRKKVNDQFLKGGYHRVLNKNQTSVYIKQQVNWCRRYCSNGKHIGTMVARHVEVTKWLQNIRLFEARDFSLYL